VVVDKDVKAANKVSDEITSQGLGAAASSIEVSIAAIITKQVNEAS